MRTRHMENKENHLVSYLFIYSNQNQIKGVLFDEKYFFNSFFIYLHYFMYGK